VFSARSCVLVARRDAGLCWVLTRAATYSTQRVAVAAVLSPGFDAWGSHILLQDRQGLPGEGGVAEHFDLARASGHWGQPEAPVGGGARAAFRGNDGARSCSTSHGGWRTERLVEAAELQQRGPGSQARRGAAARSMRSAAAGGCAGGSMAGRTKRQGRWWPLPPKRVQGHRSAPGRRRRRHRHGARSAWTEGTRALRE
jgi:hypothetical protein